MDNKKTVRLKPEIKEFLAIIGLGKYVLCGIAFIFMIAFFLCALLLGEGAEMFEIISLSAELTTVMCGGTIILATLLDMLVSLIKWIATHKVTFIKIEEKNLKIM